MKLLVATDFPPDAPGGGPAVIRQMLRGFGGQVYWWSCRPSPHSSVPGFASRVTKLIYASPGKLFPQKRCRRLKGLAMQVLWAPYAARSLRDFLGKTAPDCVWAIPHDWSIFPLHKALLDSGHRHWRLHTTIQDFPDIHHHSSEWGSKVVSALVRKQEALFASADSADATSLPMLDSLRQRTGKEGVQMLHAGLESEDFRFLETPPGTPPSQGPIRIAYAGTILVETEFVFFTKLLAQIRHLGVDLCLDFWGAHSYAGRSWFRKDWMREHGHLSETELVQHLRRCSWGFIPMSFTDQDPRYNRFSFPTKFITYLAAGLPILSLGHPESSLMKMTSLYQVGLRTPESDFDGHTLLALKKALSESKSHYIPEILRCARNHFDAQKMRTRLWSCLNAPRSW